MGGCSGKQSAVSEEAATKSKGLAKTLQDDAKKDARIHKLLLLGPGESGKSTFYKQMAYGYGGGFDGQDYSRYIEPIRSNMVVYLAALADSVATLGITTPLSEASQATHAKIKEDSFMNHLEDSFRSSKDELKSLWMDLAIQEAWASRSKIQVPESTKYFLDNRIDDAASVDYKPTLEDLLRIRVRTTGIVEQSFSVQNEKFMMIDVGGQRSERRKWIKCFDSVTAVIFLVAVSEYDQVIFEDEITNRLAEALKVFEDIYNNEVFKRCPVMLFLNKIDLFEEKIKTVSLKQCFEDYDGPDQDKEAALTFIKGKFEALCKDNQQRLFVHETCATDKDNAMRVFDAVRNTIVSNAMADSGLY